MLEVVNPVVGVTYTYDHTVLPGVLWSYRIYELFDTPCNWRVSLLITASNDQEFPHAYINADKATVDYGSGDTGVLISWNTEDCHAASLWSRPDAGGDAVKIQDLTPNMSGSINLQPVEGTVYEVRAYTLSGVDVCVTDVADYLVEIVCPTVSAPVVIQGSPEGTLRITYVVPAPIFDGEDVTWQLMKVDGGGDIQLDSGTVTEGEIALSGYYDDAALTVDVEYCYYLLVDFGGACSVQSPNGCGTPAIPVDCITPIDAQISVDDPILYSYLGQDSTNLNISCVGCDTVTVTTVNDNGTISVTTTAAVFPLYDLHSTTTITVDITPADPNCSPVTLTEIVEVVTEPEPTLTLEFVTSPACPDDGSYLHWTASNVQPGKVKITGPMFGAGYVVLNPLGETSGVIPLTVREGDETLDVFGRKTYSLTWTAKAYYSDGVTEAVSITVVGCLKPMIDSFTVNGDAVGPVAIMAGDGVDLAWTAVNCENIYITDQFGTTQYSAASGGVTLVYTQAQTVTIGGYETPCGATCNTKSIEVQLMCTWPVEGGPTESDGRPEGWPLQLTVNGLENIIYPPSCSAWCAGPDDTWDVTLTWSTAANMYVSGSDFGDPHQFGDMVLDAAYLDVWGQHSQGELGIAWSDSVGNCSANCFEADSFGVIGVAGCPFDPIQMTQESSGLPENVFNWTDYMILGSVDGQGSVNITIVNV